MKLKLPGKLVKLILAACIMIPDYSLCAATSGSITLSTSEATTIGDHTLSGSESIAGPEGVSQSQDVNTGDLIVTGTLTVNGQARVIVDGPNVNDCSTITANKIVVNGTRQYTNEPNVHIARGKIMTLEVQNGTVVLNKDLMNSASVSNAKHIVIEDEIKQSGGTILIGSGDSQYQKFISTLDSAVINQSKGNLTAVGSVYAKGGLEINQTGAGSIDFKSSLKASGAGTYKINQSAGTMKIADLNVSAATTTEITQGDAGNMSVTKMTLGSSKKATITQGGAGNMTVSEMALSANGTTDIKQTGSGVISATVKAGFSSKGIAADFLVEQSGSGTINLTAGASYNVTKTGILTQIGSGTVNMNGDFSSSSWNLHVGGTLNVDGSLTLGNTLEFGIAAREDADGGICLKSGSELDLSNVESTSLVFYDDMADLLFEAGDDAIEFSATLFSGLDEASAGEIIDTLSGTLNVTLAGNPSMSVMTENLTLSAASAEDGTYRVQVSGFASVPEPTTATLSLLALAGLAARRRRK